MSTRERIFLDDWELTDGVARDWETFDGMDGAAPYAGVNTTIPGHPGELWTPKRIGPGSFVLNVWLAGVDRGDMLEHWRTLLRAARRPHRQVVVTRVLPSGEQIFARTECPGVIEPTFVGHQGMRAALTFTVAYGLWESWTRYAFTSAGATSMPQTLVMQELAASTAVMDKGTITIHGPITNPVVVDVTDGMDDAWIRYIGTVPEGKALVLNSFTYEITGTDGFVPNLAAISYSGPKFMAVPAPRPGQSPRLQLRGTGTGELTRLNFATHRAYVC